MTHVVIGAGEVGRAIAAVLRDRYTVRLRDVAAEVGEAEVLHVCFPWSARFEAAVAGYVEAYAPELTIIHSTVPVGTSRRLGAVHSPVTGKHPDLERSVRTFTKFFGGERADEAATYFAACGVPTEVLPDAETSEAGKLWATLQYGWLVALEKEAHRFATHHGLDPDLVYGRFNEAYNEGYAALGEPYRLAVLRHMPGTIGGHCVIPNARMTPTPVARALLALDRHW